MSSVGEMSRLEEEGGDAERFDPSSSEQTLRKKQQEMEELENHEFDAPFSAALGDPPVDIKIGVRIRPQTEYEYREKMRKIFQIQDGEFVIFHPDAEEGVLCDFEYVYSDREKQKSIYRDFGIPALAYGLAGYNSAIFLYGPSHSGKNYTMFASCSTLDDVTDLGLARRMARDLLHHIDKWEEDVDFHLEMDMFEVNSDKLRDLLEVVDVNDDPSIALKRVHKDPKTGHTSIENLSTWTIRSIEDFEHTLSRGLFNRDAETYMRHVRWHTILRFHLIQSRDRGEITLKSTITLVSLKGPDRMAKKGARGDVLREDASVNKAMSAAFDVLNALSQSNRSPSSPLYIPYEESKLTSVLRDEIGGNCTTSFLVCLPPTEYNYNEVLEVLDFVRLLREISCHPVRNEEPTYYAKFRDSLLKAREKLPKSSLASGHPLSEQEENYARLLQTFEKTFSESLENPFENCTIIESHAMKRQIPEYDLSQETKLWRTSEVLAKRHGDRATMFYPTKKGKSKMYAGQWEADKQSGMGRMETNRTVYEGEWFDGKKEGFGTLYVKEKGGELRRVYKGDWMEGKRNGFGVQFFKNGDIYQGEWVDDKRHGEGTLFLADGDKYEGEWSFDKMHGFGRVVYVNGDRFEGNYANGLREGSGVHYYLEKNKKFVGEWLEDVMKCGEFSVLDENSDVGQPIPENYLADPVGVLQGCRHDLQKLRAKQHQPRNVMFVIDQSSEDGFSTS